MELMKYGYNLGIYRQTGLCITIDHDLETYCHILVTGSSGSGKSHTIMYLTGMLLKGSPAIDLWFCDFKNSEDFSFLKEYPFYFAGNDCYDGIMQYYQTFCHARETGNAATRHILIYDEYPALVNYLEMQDKANKTKKASEIMAAIYEILCLGRGIGFGAWICTQRADSTLFKNGCRDNFMIVIALGNLSREQKGMVCRGEDIPDEIYKIGEGILLADGQPVTEVKYPRIQDIQDWKMHILEILLHQWHS